MQQSSNMLFLESRSQSMSQGLRSWCPLRGFHYNNMHAKYKVFISFFYFGHVNFFLPQNHRQVQDILDGHKFHSKDIKYLDIHIICCL